MRARWLDKIASSSFSEDDVASELFFSQYTRMLEHLCACFQLPAQIEERGRIAQERMRGAMHRLDLVRVFDSDYELNWP